MSSRIGTHPHAVSTLPLAGGVRSARGVLRDYVSLTKPRVMVLLLLTELTAMVTVGRTWPTARETLAALAGGCCAAGGASALNCWWDRDIDRLMRRTAQRPLPSGRMRPAAALLFGTGLLVTATAVLWTLANPASALLALVGAAYYVLLYTMTLKRHTTQNIVIGGAAGAVPVLVGSAIVSGGIGWAAAGLFAIVFLWTPPHSWSLALLLRRDYSQARVPMLPSVASTRHTHRAILAYVLVLIPVSLLPAVTLGAAYAVAALALGCYYLLLAVRALRQPGTATAGRLFRYSLVYLAALFACGAAVALVGPIR